MKSKKFLAPVIGASFLMLGLSMPSCPGQQAMQQQVDALKNGDSELRARLSGMEGQLKGLRDELDQTKGMISQLNATVTEQGQAIEQLKSAKPAKAAAAPAPKSAGKTKGRKR